MLGTRSLYGHVAGFNGAVDPRLTNRTVMLVGLQGRLKSFGICCCAYSLGPVRPITTAAVVDRFARFARPPGGLCLSNQLDKCERPLKGVERVLCAHTLYVPLLVKG